MAPPSNLSKVSMEAFMLLEKYDRRNGRAGKPHHIHVHPPRDGIIDSFQAAQKYGGFMLCEHNDKKMSVNKFY